MVKTTKGGLVPVTTYLQPEVYEGLVRLAELTDRSVAAEVRMAVRQRVLRKDDFDPALLYDEIEQADHPAFENAKSARRKRK